MLMLFNAIMLVSGGSTIDSAFTSTAKLVGRDWRHDPVAVAIVGNLPLLTIYMATGSAPR